MDAKDCHALNLTNETPDGEKLQHFGNGLKGTSNNDFPEGNTFGDAKKQHVNYYVAEILLTVNPINEVIEPIGAATVNPCKLNDLQCKSIKGLIMWKKEDHKSCRIEVAKATPCLKTGKRITCRETLTTITDWELIELCGIKVAVSSTGVMFSTNISQELDPKINSTSNIMNQMKIGNQISISKYLDTEVISTTQFGAHMDHITTVVNENVKSIITTFHDNQCRMNRMQLAMHLHEASQGNVNGLIWGLLGDNSFRYASQYFLLTNGLQILINGKAMNEIIHKN